MIQKNQQSTNASINSNLRLSVLFGPLRMLVPAILNVILYALLVRFGGFQLVGTWATIQLVLYYLGVLDLGFGKLIQQQIASGNTSKIRLEEKYRLLILFYLCSGLVLVLLCYYLGDYLLGISNMFGRWQTALMLIIVICAILAILCNLQSSILIGNHKLFFVQGIELLQAIMSFVIAIIGLYLGFPIGGLLIGLLLSLLTRMIITSILIYRYNPGYFWLLPRFGNYASVLDLLRKGENFFLLFIADYFRYPLVRLIVLLSLGTTALGIYDVANKIPQMLRDAFGSGLSAIFPAFSSWYSKKDSNVALSALQRVLVYISTTSVLFLGIYYALSPYVIKYWIGTSINEIVLVSRILTVWWLVSSYMIPYWWAALGLGLVKLCSMLYWMHVALIIILWTVGINLDFSVSDYAWMLVVSGTIMQITFFFYLEKKTHLLSATLKDKSTCIITACSVILFVMVLLNAELKNLSFSLVANVVMVLSFIFYISMVAYLKREDLSKMRVLLIGKFICI
jgi:O-antigen/teichoic acid export membrane protein